MNALRSLSGQLARIKAAALLASGLATVMLMLYVFGVILPAIRAQVGQPDFEVVDAYLVRTPSMTFDNLETLGAKGRSIYLRMAAADVFIPAVYAVLFGGLMARAWGVTPAPRKHESLAWVLPLLPVAAAAADYVENACTLFHIWRLPQHDVGVAWIGTGATFVKYVLLSVSLLLIAVGWLMGKGRSRKVKASA